MKFSEILSYIKPKNIIKKKGFGWLKKKGRCK